MWLTVLSVVSMDTQAHLMCFLGCRGFQPRPNVWRRSPTAPPPPPARTVSPMKTGKSSSALGVSHVTEGHFQTLFPTPPPSCQPQAMTGVASA